MGFTSNIKRLAHKVEIDGQTFFVRALTLKESDQARAKETAAEQDDLGLRFGVCDANGQPTISDDEDLTLLPMNFRQALMQAIIDVTIPAAKKN